jgi:hypothetical protein
VFYWESRLFFWAQLAQLSDWADATDPWLQVACDYWDHGHHSGTCIAGICWNHICFLELFEFLELPGFRRWRPRRIVWATYSVLWHIQHLWTCAQRFRMVHRKHQWSHKAVGSRLEMKKPEFIFNVIEQAFLDFNCLSPKMGTLNPRVYYHHHARWNGNCGVCTVSGQTHLPSCACLLRLSGAASKASKEPVSWSPVRVDELRTLLGSSHQCRASNIKFIQVGVWKAHHGCFDVEVQQRCSLEVEPLAVSTVPVVMQSFPNRARRPKQGTAVGAYVSNGMSYRQWEAKPGPMSRRSHSQNWMMVFICRNPR